MSQATTTNTLAKAGTPNGEIQKAAPKGFTAVLEARRDTFVALLPKSADVERFIRSAAFACARNPTLRQCSQESLIAAACTAAELNLDFTPALGLAYMVPYGKDAQFQIGYRGLMTLAMREGAARSFEAHCVFENDEFEHEMGTEPRITHKRPQLGQARGKFVGAYAVVTLANGIKQADVMDLAEIEAIRTRSKAGNGGPWKTDYSEMAKKTVVKRLCKYLNLTPTIGKALEQDNEDTELNGGGDDRPSNTSRLRQVIEQPNGPAIDTSEAQEPASTQGEEDPEIPF